jgi:ribosomal-protein-alanine N-acetyltransferase
MTTTNNIASQKLLVRNGFREIGMDEEKFEVNGEKVRLVNMYGRIKET